MICIFVLLTAHVTAKGTDGRLAALEPKIHELLHNMTTRSALCPDCKEVSSADPIPDWDPNLKQVCFNGEVVKENTFAAFYNLECFDGPNVKEVKPNAFFANYKLKKVSESIKGAVKGEGAFYLTYNLGDDIIKKSPDIRSARFIKGKDSASGCPTGIVKDEATDLERCVRPQSAVARMIPDGAPAPSPAPLSHVYRMPQPYSYTSCE